VGAALSELVGLNGISRKPGLASTLQLTVNTTGGSVDIPFSFRLEGETGETFFTNAPGSYANGSTIVMASIEHVALIFTGPEVWRILTPVSGLDSLDTLAQLQIGSPDESDAELRARQILSTENGATNILESLYSSLLQVSGVARVRIYVNDTNSTVDGRPAHSYEVVVDGGADLDVAEAIWDRHPAGIELFGTTSQNITDSQGQTQAIEFTRPVVVPIYIIVNTSADARYPATGDEDIKQAIVDYANGLLVEDEQLTIGDDVRQSRLFTPANSIQGHNVVTILIGIAPTPTLETDIVIDETEIAQFLIANIIVNS
jgi:uncharacterized phage protein gp47/JayE